MLDQFTILQNSINELNNAFKSHQQGIADITHGRVAIRLNIDSNHDT